MSKYIFKRVLLMIPTLIGAGVLVFFLMRLIPGDVCELRFAGTGLYVDQAQIDTCRSNLGIDRPMFVQFADFMIGFFTFNFGDSMWTGKPILFEIGLRFELSLQVAIMATFVAVIIAIPLGAISAIKQDTWLDYAVRTFAIAGIAIPSFWLGIMIILGLLIVTQQVTGIPWYTCHLLRYNQQPKNNHNAEPERRDCNTSNRECPHGIVKPSVLFDSRNSSQWNCNNNCNKRSHNCYLQR